MYTYSLQRVNQVAPNVLLPQTCREEEREREIERERDRERER